MADTIQIRAGKKAGMPTLAVRELGYVTDEKALYIGTANGNVKLCDADLEDTVKNKLTATPVAAQGSLDAAAELAAVITAYNNLIAAMKASGMMAT